MHKKVYLFKRVLHFYEVFFLKKWDLFLLCVVEIDKKKDLHLIERIMTISENSLHFLNFNIGIIICSY